MKTTYLVIWFQNEEGAQTWKVGEYKTVEEAKRNFFAQMKIHEEDILWKQPREIQDRPDGRYTYNLELCRCDETDDDMAVVTIATSGPFFIVAW